MNISQLDSDVKWLPSLSQNSANGDQVSGEYTRYSKSPAHIIASSFPTGRSLCDDVTIKWLADAWRRNSKTAPFREQLIGLAYDRDPSQTLPTPCYHLLGLAAVLGPADGLSYTKAEQPRLPVT